MLSKNGSKISDSPSYLYPRQKRMICKQSMGPICLLSQKNASYSNNAMAKWKGLNMIKVNLPIFFCQGPCGLTASPRMARPPLDHENSSSSP
jgi:hypothetical protein